MRSGAPTSITVKKSDASLSTVTVTGCASAAAGSGVRFSATRRSSETAPRSRLAKRRAELAPALLPHLRLEHTLDLEQVDGRTVLGREHLRREDRQAGQRQRAGDPRQQPRAVGGDDGERVGRRSRSRARQRSNLERGERGRDQRVVLDDPLDRQPQEVAPRHPQQEPVDRRGVSSGSAARSSSARAVSRSAVPAPISPRSSTRWTFATSSRTSVARQGVHASGPVAPASAIARR